VICIWHSIPYSPLRDCIKAFHLTEKEIRRRDSRHACGLNDHNITPVPAVSVNFAILAIFLFL